jgi:hypothetical protein
MRILLILTLIVFTSSCSEKIIELPEIKHSTISEVIDISPAYLFYDETQPDSLELNRKNLISSTNWVVNVDKRLTLNQVIPQIQFLQNKKNSSSHKNEAAKNYYTCNNTSIQNLGFIEFTDIYYILKNSEQSEGASVSNEEIKLQLFVSHSNNMELKTNTDSLVFSTTRNKLVSDLNQLEFDTPVLITLNLSGLLTFQDYITLKDELPLLDSEVFSINNNEFIY